MKYIVDILPLNRSVVCIDSINEAPDDVIEDWNKTKTNAMTYVYNGDVYIVFNRADKKVGAGILCHEVYHAVNRLFDIIGYKVDTTNDEIGAYLMEYIYRELCDFVFYPNRVMKKSKKDTKDFDKIYTREVRK